jgi:hypothetical protein
MGGPRLMRSGLAGRRTQEGTLRREPALSNVRFSHEPVERGMAVRSREVPTHASRHHQPRLPC